MSSEKIDPERNDFEKVLEIYHWAMNNLSRREQFYLAESIANMNGFSLIADEVDTVLPGDQTGEGRGLSVATITELADAAMAADEGDGRGF